MDSTRRNQLDDVNKLYWNNQHKSWKDEKEKPCRVFYYGRVSTEHAQQTAAFNQQLQYYNMLNEVHKNWICSGEFSDQSTGTNTNRKGFNDMIQLAMNGGCDLIVTRDWSRWGRDVIGNIKFVRMLKEVGVEVHAVSDGSWSFEENSGFMIGLHSLISEQESTRISIKVKAGQMVSRNNHILYGNNLFGYKLSKGVTSKETRYIIDDEQSETVKRIFQLYSENFGMSKICQILMQEGRLNNSSKCKFDATMLSRILSNRAYTGCLSYNKSSKADLFEKRKVNKDKSTHVYIKDEKVPQIISDELFERVQSIRESKKIRNFGQGQGKRVSEEKYLSKMRCYCTKTFRRDRWRFINGIPVYGYICRNYKEFQGKAVNGVICQMHGFPQWHMDLQWFYIVNYIFDQPEQTVRKLIALVDEMGIHDDQYENDVRKIDQFANKKETLNNRLNNLRNKWLDNLLDDDSYKKITDELKKEIMEIDNQITEINSMINSKDDDSSIRIETIHKIEAELLGGEKYSEFNYENEEMFKAIVAKIIVKPDHTFSWYLNIVSTKGCVTFDKAAYELYDYFTISFDMAKKFRKRSNQYLRSNQYNDIKVEVYFRCK